MVAFRSSLTATVGIWNSTALVVDTPRIVISVWDSVGWLQPFSCLGKTDFAISLSNKGFAAKQSLLYGSRGGGLWFVGGELETSFLVGDSLLTLFAHAFFVIMGTQRVPHGAGVAQGLTTTHCGVSLAKITKLMEVNSGSSVIAYI